jgi:mannitol-1-phosphate/altronate dehydrogenase
VDDQGEQIVLEDARAAELQRLALAGRDDPRPLLGLRDLFGDLSDCEAFVAELQTTLREVYALGARAALARLLEERGF